MTCFDSTPLQIFACTKMRVLFLLIAISVVAASTETDGTKGPKGETDFVEKEYGVRYADTCEVCKYLVTELDLELQATGTDLRKRNINFY